MKDKKFFVFVVSAVLFNLLLNSVFLRNPRIVLIVFLIQLTFIVFIHFLSRRQSEGRQFGVEDYKLLLRRFFPSFTGTLALSLMADTVLVFVNLLITTLICGGLLMKNGVTPYLLRK